MVAYWRWKTETELRSLRYQGRHRQRGDTVDQDYALRNAEALGYDDVGIVNVILGIERRMFVKSMTTFENHRLWQDVYHVPARGLILYVKFQEDLLTDFAVVSFKEK